MSPMNLFLPLSSGVLSINFQINKCVSVLIPLAFEYFYLHQVHSYISERFRSFLISIERLWHQMCSKWIPLHLGEFNRRNLLAFHHSFSFCDLFERESYEKVGILRLLIGFPNSRSCICISCIFYYTRFKIILSAQESLINYELSMKYVVNMDLRFNVVLKSMFIVIVSQKTWVQFLDSVGECPYIYLVVTVKQVNATIFILLTQMTTLTSERMVIQTHSSVYLNLGQDIFYF